MHTSFLVHSSTGILVDSVILIVVNSTEKNNICLNIMIHFLCIYNHSVVSKSSGNSLANLKCPILLPQLLEYWNYRPVPPHLTWFMCVKNLHMVNHQQCGRVSLFQHHASISHFSSFLWVSMTRVRWSVMGLILIPFVISSRSISSRSIVHHLCIFWGMSTQVLCPIPSPLFLLHLSVSGTKVEPKASCILSMHFSMMLDFPSSHLPIFEIKFFLS